ncbi:MAG: HNH endonuclease [Reinekea sp.]
MADAMQEYAACDNKACKDDVLSKYREKGEANLEWLVSNCNHGGATSEACSNVVNAQNQSVIDYQNGVFDQYVNDQDARTTLTMLHAFNLSERNVAGQLATGASADAIAEGMGLTGETGETRAEVVEAAVVVAAALLEGRQVKGLGSNQKGTENARGEYTRPYDPNKTREDLEATHGEENVTSTTNPKKPVQSVNSNPEKGVEVITDANGGKAVRVRYDDPVTGEEITANVPYNDRGLPVFDDYSKYTTTIDHSLSYQGQMRKATRDLRESIKSGRTDSTQFTEQQLRQIQSGSASIAGFTWHHNADSGNMQLVPKNVHTAVQHTGQGALNEGK